MVRFCWFWWFWWWKPISPILALQHQQLAGRPLPPNAQTSGGVALGALCGLTAPELAFPRSDGSEVSVFAGLASWKLDRRCYPLVTTTVTYLLNMAIEIVSFPNETWWFSKAMLKYQRVITINHSQSQLITINHYYKSLLIQGKSSSCSGSMAWQRQYGLRRFILAEQHLLSAGWHPRAEPVPSLLLGGWGSAVIG